MNTFNTVMDHNFTNLANLNSSKYHIRLVCVLAISFYSISIVGAYLNGRPAYNAIFAFFSLFEPLVLALFAVFMRRLIDPNSSKKVLLYLPYIAISIPVLNSVFSFFLKNFDVILYAIIYNFLLITTHMFVLFAFIRPLQRRLVYAKPWIDEEEFKKVKDMLNNFCSPAESEVKDNTPTILEKVIQSILIRVSSSNRAVTFSLIIMVLMVIIGGGASFGTVALSEANKIRELEVERGNLLRLTYLLNHPDSIKDNNHYKEIRERISLKYGNQNSYKNLLENIEKQSYISWPDIAMRITIAALTLFLVQIFFHIYKYNQQQASQLMNKAETLELFREADANQAELRTFLLSKSDFSTKFDKSPVSPTEQIINIIGKSKDS